MNMRGSRKFCQRGPEVDNFFIYFFYFIFFLVDEGIEDPNTTINGPSLFSLSNAGFVALLFFRGSGPVLLRFTIFL